MATGVGRLLITLYLVSHNLLAKPSLYLSDYFEKNKGAYYDALTRVRVSNDPAHWIKMFLVAVIATAEKAKNTFQDILKLRNESDTKIMAMGRRAKNAQKFLMLLYKQPAVNIATITKHLKISNVAANELVKTMIRAGILVEMTGFKRNRLFQFQKYLELFLH